MIARVKTFFKWVYDWITVLTASLVGLPDLVLQLLNSFSGVDIAPLVGSQRAVQIVTIVALLKGLLSALLALRKPAA